MRKPQNFSVAPMSDGRIMIQSDKSIGMFDPETGAGVLNIRGCYFPHLHAALGAKPITFPADFVAECVKVLPTPGGQTSLAGGAIVVVNTVQVIS
jgi:hypothetical protein